MGVADTELYPGQESVETQSSDFNTVQFIIER